MAAPSLFSIIGRSSSYEYGPTSARWVDRFLCLYWGLQAGHELVDLLMRDVALTRDEIDGLMAGLLTSGDEPTGRTRLSDWLDDDSDGFGRRYVSELRA